MSVPGAAIETFVEQDRAFFNMLDATRLCDPLQVRGTGTLAPFQQREHAPPDAAVLGLVERLEQWQVDNPEPSLPEITAVHRDIDKLTGCFVAQRTTLEAPPRLTRALINLMTDQVPGSPRANFYSYSVGNNPDKDGTYTGDEREERLIGLFGTSIEAAHTCLHSVLRARQAMRQDDTATAESELEGALESVGTMHRPMVEAYRAVGPAFVAVDLTPYLGGYKRGDDKYHGPNPSHSGFMALDRFLLGSFEPMYEGNEALRGQVRFRSSDLPQHVSDIITVADEHDEEGLVELAATLAPNCVEIAKDIVTKVKKFKVAHKSYADKGLVATGRTLSPEEPDLLSASIDYAKSKT